MTPQSSVDAEMQYLLGVTEDSADSAPAIEGASEQVI